jgi:hypothetical protein
MHNCMKVGFTLLAFLAVGMVAASSAYAAERDMGKISQADLRNACNNVGGDLLGVSDSGSYGCEDNQSGNMILCNKDSNCTLFTPARTHSDHVKGLKAFNPQLLKSEMASAKKNMPKPKPTAKPDSQ